MTRPRSQRRMTPAEVRNVTFDTNRFGSRGYRESDVDAFVDHMADLLADRDREIAREREEVHRIRRWRQEHGIPDEGARNPTSAEVQLYTRAQLRAEALEAQAQKTVHQADEAARQRFADTLNEAREQAKVLGVHAAVIRTQLEAQLQRLMDEIHMLGAPVEPDPRFPAPSEMPGAHHD